MPNELKHLKPLIKNKTITVFGQLFDYVSIKELAEVMGCSVQHIKRLKKEPLKVRLGEVENLKLALGYDHWAEVGVLFMEG